jgi:hypothetical protein
MISIVGSTLYCSFEENADKSNIYDASARVSRTATLDGGVAITHSGMVHGDRTILAYAFVDSATEATLKSIHETDTLVYLSCKEGYFSGVIERLVIQGGEMNMTFLAKEKLSA